jgi:hypothetical protein
MPLDRVRPEDRPTPRAERAAQRSNALQLADLYGRRAAAEEVAKAKRRARSAAQQLPTPDQLREHAKSLYRDLLDPDLREVSAAVWELQLARNAHRDRGPQAWIGPPQPVRVAEGEPDWAEVPTAPIGETPDPTGDAGTESADASLKLDRPSKNVTRRAVRDLRRSAASYGVLEAGCVSCARIEWVRPVHADNLCQRCWRRRNAGALPSVEEIAEWRSKELGKAS